MTGRKITVNSFLFVLLVLLWGSAYSMMKAGFAYFPPVLYAALMFEVTGTFMFIALCISGSPLFPADGRAWVQFGIGAVLMIAGYHAFLFLGQQYTNTVYAAVIVSSSPILTAFLAGLMLPTRVFTFREVFGLMISFSGVLLLLLGRAPEEPLLMSGLIGIGPMFILLGVLLFDGGVVVLKWFGEARSPYVFLTWSMLGGGTLLHAIGTVGLGERLSDITLNATSMALFSYFTIGPTLIGYLIYYHLMQRMDVVRLNIVSYFTPVAAAVIGYLWLSEIPRWSTLVGFGLVIGGFLVTGPVVHALAGSKE